jgi:hypothetical protein
VHGHLHDGGENVKIYRNGQEVCDTKAIYGGEKGTTQIGGAKWETIQGYEFCRKPIEIKKGDELVVEAKYDLIAHRL